MPTLESALKRLQIPVRKRKGFYYLVDPPVRKAHFQVTPDSHGTVSIQFFDALMGSIAKSGRPIQVPEDPRSIARAIKDRMRAAWPVESGASR